MLLRYNMTNKLQLLKIEAEVVVDELLIKYLLLLLYYVEPGNHPHRGVPLRLVHIFVLGWVVQNNCLPWPGSSQHVSRHYILIVLNTVQYVQSCVWKLFQSRRAAAPLEISIVQKTRCFCLAWRQRLCGYAKVRFL